MSLDEGLSNKNEFNAIQVCIRKAISSVPYQRAGKCTSLKTISIDVPCSQKVFLEKFANSVTPIHYCLQENYKCTVSPSDLNAVFGEDWHVFNYHKSSTRHRIIGLIVIHFRNKTTRMSTFATHDR